MIYPRTCPESYLGLPCSISPRPADMSLRLAAWRAEYTAEKTLGGDRWYFQETGDKNHGLVGFTPDEFNQQIGDVVLSRKGLNTSYHLSVVMDDAAQRVTHIVRGEDLFEATKIHVILQKLLNLPTPTYHHHRLIRDDQGKRLAKRDDARALAKFRAEGATPGDIRRMVGL